MFQLPQNYAGRGGFPARLRGRGGGGGARKKSLAGSSSTRAKALDLPCLRRRNVVRTPSHLAHEPLLLHLAPELAQRLLELLGILDDYPHNPTRIQAEERGPLC